MSASFMTQRLFQGVFWGVSACLFFVLPCASAQEAGSGSSVNKNKRDPFVPLISPSGILLKPVQEESGLLQLEGIMYSQQGRSLAVLNGNVVGVGDTVGDVLVVNIEIDRVIVLRDHEKVELMLRREE